MNHYDSDRLKRELQEIVRTFSHGNYIDEIRGACGDLEITMKRYMTFDEKGELQKAISVLLDWDIDRVKIIA